MHQHDSTHGKYPWASYESPNFSDAILVPCTREVIFLEAMIRTTSGELLHRLRGVFYGLFEIARGLGLVLEWSSG